MRTNLLEISTALDFNKHEVLNVTKRYKNLSLDVNIRHPIGLIYRPEFMGSYPVYYLPILSLDSYIYRYFIHLTEMNRP
jgi:hypothetical protein